MRERNREYFYKFSVIFIKKSYLIFSFSKVKSSWSNFLKEYNGRILEKENTMKKLNNSEYLYYLFSES